jgi:hypothetical protein
MIDDGVVFTPYGMTDTVVFENNDAERCCTARITTTCFVVFEENRCLMALLVPVNDDRWRCF